MKIVCIGGGPRRPVLRHPDEDAPPGARHHGGGAQQALRHLWLGRGLLGRHHGQHAPVGPGHTAAAHPARPSTTGTTSNCSSRARPSAPGGHGFVGIGRKKLLNILQARCEQLGVKLVFETDVPTPIADYPDADLIIASDGINSRIRTRYESVFKPDIVVRPNRYIWLGTHKLYDAFTFLFEKDRARLVPGPHLQVRREHHHLHRRMPGEHVWQAHRAGQGRAPTASIAFCEKVCSPAICRAPN